jgi:hypothetical protein
MSIEWGIEELAYRAGGKTEDETEAAINDGDIDEFIYEKYEIDFDTYFKIVQDLIPFTPAWEVSAFERNLPGVCGRKPGDC